LATNGTPGGGIGATGSETDDDGMFEDGNGFAAARGQVLHRKNPDPSYGPENAIPPGRLLATHLAARKMSQAECARRCGRSPKLISEIIAGKAPIQPETALQLERVLGLRSSVWLGIENDYRLLLARRAEAERAEAEREWLDAFPLGELVGRGVLAERAPFAEKLDDLLAFFGVGSIAAWEAWFGSMRIEPPWAAQPGIDRAALATWIRLGDLSAGKIHCEEYDGRTFREASRVMARLIGMAGAGSHLRATELCQAAGVALVQADPLPGTGVVAATRWMTPRKAVIQLAIEPAAGDRFWFTLFHSAAHLLFHSKKRVFVEPEGAVRTVGGAGTKDVEDIETQADAWAATLLARW